MIEQSSLQRVEHAREPAYPQNHQRLQSALPKYKEELPKYKEELLKYKEALLECKEALLKLEEGLNGDEPQPPKG